MQKTDLLTVLAKTLEKETGEIVCLEHRFCPERKWRLDLAIPALAVGLEVQGGLFVRGRHVQGDGAAKDQAKMNQAQVMGWIVLQCQPREIASPQLMQLLLTAVQRQRENLADWSASDTITLPTDQADEGAAADYNHRTNRPTRPAS